MELADKLAWKITDHHPDQVFVDGIGIGAGVVDRLLQLKFGKYVTGVNVSNEAQDEKYSNKRSEIWGLMKDWLVAGGQIPNDPRLAAELSCVPYFYDARDRIALVSKEKLKEKKSISSPDMADALALTFSYPVERTAGEEDDSDFEYISGSDGNDRPRGAYSPY